MNQKTLLFIFAAIRSAVTDTPLRKEERELFSKELLPEYYSLAKKHDLAHLVAVAIENNGLLDKPNPSLTNSVMAAVYRYEQQHHELERICELLEAEGIDFLPLKGSVLRDYYPEGWLRTSSDIDILVKEADFERARTAIVEKLGYRYESDSPHDSSLYYGDNLHFEIHHTLINEGFAKNASEILANVWSYTHPKTEKRHHQDRSHRFRRRAEIPVVREERRWHQIQQILHHLRHLFHQNDG